MHCLLVHNRVLGLGLCALICVSGLGCGGQKVPPLSSVSGKVTYNGMPLPGATVMFIPDVKVAAKAKKGDDNPPAPNRPMGKSDDEGNYALLWSDDHEGAPEGKYRVAISAVAFEPGDDEDEARPNQVPNKYGNPDTSGFTAVVEQDGDNVFDFELVD